MPEEEIEIEDESFDISSTPEIQVKGLICSNFNNIQTPPRTTPQSTPDKPLSRADLAKQAAYFVDSEAKVVSACGCVTQT